MTVNGNYSQSSGGFYVADIAGPTVDTQYDQLIVNGVVSLAGTLGVQYAGTPAGARILTLIDNDGADAVVGNVHRPCRKAPSSRPAAATSALAMSAAMETTSRSPACRQSRSTMSPFPRPRPTATFTVTLSDTNASALPTTVNWSTSDGTAAAGSDYTAASGMVTFNPGVTSQPIVVTLTPDTIDEVNETFNINLSNAVNGLITDNLGVGTITDDDPAPTISISDAPAVTEGNSGTTFAGFTVSLSAASGKTVTVLASTANGTATSPADYTAITNQLITFLPGETSKPLNVSVAGDTLDEADNDTFFVNLSSPSNATTLDAQGQGNITDDDALPAISISDVTVTEGNSGTIAAVFTVTLSPASGRNVTLNYATANGTATAGSDFTAIASTPLTFTPGQTSKTISVTVSGDTVQ
jgi:hypothetical protein